MGIELSRRDFLRTTAAGAAGLAMSGVLGGAVSAEETETTPLAPSFPGRARFTGVPAVRSIKEDLVYLGVSDQRTALFENVYPIPRGVTYNSYLLLDEKTVLFDTVDRSVTGQFIENLVAALDGRDLDYLLVQHMEPDHCAGIPEVLSRYPNAKVLCSHLAMAMIQQFFDFDASKYGEIIENGDSLETGKHVLNFVAAPMVHWPEVMMTYDSTDKTLFSADAFGSFGALDGNLFADEVNFETDWLPDARRYYCNIVGKYGPQVQSVLGAAGGLEIETICPLHGPIWRENLGWLIDKYDKWSSYTPEEDAVAVFYGSIYGGTENAAGVLASRLSQDGIRNVQVYDVSRTHVSELIAESFRCSHLVFCSITYNMGIFTPMKNFLNDLAAHNLQKRKVSYVENGTWSPASGKLMQEIVESLPGMTEIGRIITLRSTTNTESIEKLFALADEIAADLTGGTAEETEAEDTASAVTWRCTVCGFIYEGDPLPDDYKCPICGVGPDKFEKVE